jgi:hypothetical protein
MSVKRGKVKFFAPLDVILSKVDVVQPDLVYFTDETNLRRGDMKEFLTLLWR